MTSRAKAAPQLLGLKELADHLGVSRDAVKAMRKRGQLPEPKQVLAATPVWTLKQIETWQRTRSR